MLSSEVFEIARLAFLMCSRSARLMRANQGCASMMREVERYLSFLGALAMADERMSGDRARSLLIRERTRYERSRAHDLRIQDGR